MGSLLAKEVSRLLLLVAEVVGRIARKVMVGAAAALPAVLDVPMPSLGARLPLPLALLKP